MTDTLSLDTLAGAEAAFKAAAAQLEDGTATPDVVSRVEEIIVTATRQHARWGKLTIDALLMLGLYLLRNPYRGMGKGGRPPGQFADTRRTWHQKPPYRITGTRRCQD